MTNLLFKLRQRAHAKLAPPAFRFAGRYLVVLLVGLLSIAGVQADGKALFYQPQNRDAVIDPVSWTSAWREARERGYASLVVQWTSHGESRFGGAEGWLAEALKRASAEGLDLVAGLHYDPDYPSSMAEGQGLAFRWHRWFARNLDALTTLRDDYQLSVAGWYLPLELDDALFRDPEFRREFEQQLAAFTASIGEQPLHLSAFSAGRLTPEGMAHWLAGLQGLDNVKRVWWQDGAGTGSLPPEVREAYEQALPCRVGIIREAFRQTSVPGEPFAAEPAAYDQDSGCHPLAVFSLRYLDFFPGG